ncbi:MAG: hypothetical protein JXA20_05755 [Spirochaetes bacterium]|nr:hypothetical protein [Spirochaetota bacterium]
MIQRRHITIAAVIGGIAAVAILMAVLGGRDERPSGPAGQPAGVSERPGFFRYLRSFFVPEALDYDSVTGEDLRIQWVIERMKERYGGKLGNKGIQVRLLGGLIRYMKKGHPEDWKERITLIIQRDFPERAAELMDKLNKLEEYHHFLDTRKDALARMGHGQRRDVIEEKRKEIFGGEYYEIWKRSIAREETASMLNRLDYSKNLSLDEKLDEYRSFAREFYPNEPDATLAETDDDVMVRNYKLARQFLAMPSVQSELKGMTAAERAEFLRRVRESMGLPREAVDKMAELDKVTEELWKRKE